MKKRLLTLALTLALCLCMAAPAAASAPPNPFQDMTNTDPLYQAILWAISQNQGKGISFADITEDNPFYDAILWGVGEDIAAGFEDNTFRHANTCTRAQIAAFLWRAAGRPAPPSAFSPYTDVTPSMNSDLYTATLWIAGKIGFTGENFEPYGDCTRLTAVEFLWYAAGCPETEEKAAFTDVADSAAVDWAVSQGITNGYGDGTFRPDTACSRGQIMAFLYRAGEDAFKPQK